MKRLRGGSLMGEGINTLTYLYRLACATDVR